MDGEGGGRQSASISLCGKGIISGCVKERGRARRCYSGSPAREKNPDDRRGESQAVVTLRKSSENLRFDLRPRIHISPNQGFRTLKSGIPRFFSSSRSPIM